MLLTLVCAFTKKAPTICKRSNRDLSNVPNDTWTAQKFDLKRKEKTEDKTKMKFLTSPRHVINRKLFTNTSDTEANNNILGSKTSQRTIDTETDCSSTSSTTMAIKPRGNSRASRPLESDGMLLRPTKHTTRLDRDMSEIRSLCKKDSNKTRYPDVVVQLDKETTKTTTGTPPTTKSLSDMEDLEKILVLMKKKGNSIYHSCCKERCDIASNELVSLWRQMLIKWMFYVVDCCQLQRHAVAAAAYFLDVAMLRELCVTREEHQLAAATALQMALKIFDVAVIKLDKLVKLGRGFFTAADVTNMEMKIITSLNWNLHPPTIYCYMRQYEQLAPSGITESARIMLDALTKTIVEEMIIDEHYIKYCPSAQGISALLVALDFVPDDCISSRLRRNFVARLSRMRQITAAKGEDITASPSEVRKKIYRSLQKNNKRLMVILDVVGTKDTKGAQRVLRRAETSKKKSSKPQERKKGEQQHSPRDVKADVNLRI